MKASGLLRTKWIPSPESAASSRSPRISRRVCRVGFRSDSAPTPEPGPDPGPASRVLRVSGNVPPETWNRLGTKLLPKLRSGSGLEVSVVDFRVTTDARVAKSLADDLRQILSDLGLADEVGVGEE